MALPTLRIQDVSLTLVFGIPWNSNYMDEFTRKLDGYLANLHLCMYGASTVMPITLASNDRSISQMKLRCRHVNPHEPCEQRRFLGRGTPQFGKALAERFVAWWSAQYGGKIEGTIPKVSWECKLFSPQLMEMLAEKM